MNRNEALAYLTRCADDNGTHWDRGRALTNGLECPTCNGDNDAGHLETAGSRYGRTSTDVAPIAYRHAVWYARETGQELTTDVLESSMSMAVNDHPDIAADLQGYAAELAGANVDANVDAMVDGYLTCQLWAGLDYGHDKCGDDCDRAEPHPYDDNYSREDIADEYVDTIRAEFAELVAEHPLAVRMFLNHRTTEQFGHDYYLTREGHGAGFWDRGLGELGDYLTQISEWAGPADDLSDDGTGELR